MTDKTTKPVTMLQLVNDSSCPIRRSYGNHQTNVI
jgi:hypothetical protein